MEWVLIALLGILIGTWGLTYRLWKKTNDIENTLTQYGSALLSVGDNFNKYDRKFKMHDTQLLMVHWEACKLASFFEEMGVEFNFRSIEELTEEHFEAFRRERPKYLCGLIVDAQVVMYGEGDQAATTVVTN